jgi:hypothetical protein
MPSKKYNVSLQYIIQQATKTWRQNFYLILRNINLQVEMIGTVGEGVFTQRGQIPQNLILKNYHKNHLNIYKLSSVFLGIPFALKKQIYIKLLQIGPKKIVICIYLPKLTLTESNFKVPSIGVSLHKT